MTPNSLRWRLPLSYISLALCTTLVFGGLLLITLRVYYSEREREYLSDNGILLSRQLTSLLSSGAQISSLQPQTSAYANALQARVKVYDATDNLLLDSGPPQSIPLPVQNPIITTAPSVSTQTASTTESFSGQHVEEETNINIIAFAPGESDLSRQHSNQSVSVPLANPQTSEFLGRLELSEGPAYGAQIIAGVIRIGLWVSLGAMGFAALVGWVISRRLTKPLLALAHVTTRMASGDLSVRAESHRTDEIGLLSHAFNQMAEQVQQTVVTLRNFTADAAHELHTPITALLANLDLALDHAEEDPDSPLYYARLQAHRLIELTNDLLDLSRLETQNDPAIFKPLDLTILLNGIVEIYASRAEQAEISFELILDETPTIIHGNDKQIRRALGNVLDNAIKFTPPGKSITVELQKNDREGIVKVTDMGLGIDPQDYPNVFDRFYRGRNAGAHAGSGLGLAIVKAIMEKHGGYVKANSIQNGTVFTLSWPVTDSSLRKAS